MVTKSPFSPRIRDFLAWQARFYGERRREEEVKAGPFLTISRAFGCEGVVLAQGVAERLNAISDKPTPWVVMGKGVVDAIAEKEGEAGHFVEALSIARRSRTRQTVERLVGHKPTEYQAYEKLAETLLSLAEAGRVILVGRGGAIVCGGLEGGLHVRLVAPLRWRAARIARDRGLTVPEAEAMVVHEEKAREAFVHEFTGSDRTDPERYDIVFNNERVEVDEAADLIVAALRKRGLV